MKSLQTKAAQSGVDVSNLSIPDAEEMIEEALNELSFSTDPGLAQALHFLAPAGYQAIVELCGENGRSKRRNAMAETWSPEEDEVRIYFERIDGDESAPRPARAALGGRARLRRGRRRPGSGDSRRHRRPRERIVRRAGRGRAGRTRLHRPQVVPRLVSAAQGFRWNQHPESRQAVLAEAIQRGVVVTSKIANPKTPAYPTTTIRLNRAEAGMPEEAQRFHPVAAHGDSIAEAIEEERGNL
jgi:hypothetical protein